MNEEKEERIIKVRCRTNLEKFPPDFRVESGVLSAAIFRFNELAKKRNGIPGMFLGCDPFSNDKPREVYCIDGGLARLLAKREISHRVLKILPDISKPGYLADIIIDDTTEMGEVAINMMTAKPDRFVISDLVPVFSMSAHKDGDFHIVEKLEIVGLDIVDMSIETGKSDRKKRISRRET
jgi:hypothetical protein